LGKVRQEVARHAEFAAISERIAEVNEKICEARPASPPGAPGGDSGPSLPGGEKRGSATRSRKRQARR
jgi:hypothetical protein